MLPARNAPVPLEAYPALTFIGALHFAGISILWYKFQTDPDIRHHQGRCPYYYSATPNTHLFAVRTQNVVVRRLTDAKMASTTKSDP
ncbi:hypothetical protein BGX29_009346 [Mortierella sp. GBA35]|nr:hypothetical protein BGX29_009346 [Mortierella sp. GBA35]